MEGVRESGSSSRTGLSCDFYCLENRGERVNTGWATGGSAEEWTMFPKQTGFGNRLASGRKSHPYPNPIYMLQPEKGQPVFPMCLCSLGAEEPCLNDKLLAR